MKKDKIPIDSSKKGRRLFNTQIVFGTAFTYLCSGVFLSGFAMMINADDLLINYINMITNICGITILFFSTLIGKCKNYKRVSIILTILSRLITLFIIFIPMIFPPSARIAAFITIMIVAFTLQAQTTVVINNWMVSFVDQNKSGRTIAIRQTFVLIVNVILAISGGQLLDSIPDAYLGFGILFAIAAIMSTAEVISLIFIPDAQQPTRQKYKWIDSVVVPMKNKPFLHYVLYIFFFYLLLSIADSFTVVYMMRYLQMSYTLSTGLQLIITLPQVFLLIIWGKISDKRGHRFTLIMSIWFFSAQMLFFALSNSATFLIFIPISFFFAAIGNSGFIVSVFNRRFELMPKEGRILYDNFFTATVGLAFILGPLAGSGIQRLLSMSTIVQEIEFGSIRLIYAISATALLLLQIIVILMIRKKRVKHIRCNDPACIVDCPPIRTSATISVCIPECATLYSSSKQQTTDLENSETLQNEKSEENNIQKENLYMNDCDKIDPSNKHKS